MSVTSKQYSVSLSGQMHYFKIHVSQRSPFYFFLQSALKNYEDTNTWSISHFSCFLSFSVCIPPMVYIDCGNATADVVGAGCQKSCQTLDMECVSIDSLHMVKSILNQISSTITSHSKTLQTGNVSSHVFYVVLTVQNTLCLWLCMSS